MKNFDEIVNNDGLKTVYKHSNKKPKQYEVIITKDKKKLNMEMEMIHNWN